ncbi:hypothetical protein BDF20DRAFT_908280 [Mycotypha africana]|uniref:uncharacterized protein n=1 Tax=Mycotypha africana TaxID=64632 RepID=UPI00230079AF|nr:uncharacterized protein BDF20DRAFT_908280 [Mycotypha africana]KAI8967686.1 hypothetical protein BDF20DRAFT_908280 [Mycotypha africana]
MLSSVALIASLVKSAAFNDNHNTTISLSANKDVNEKLDISPELVKAVTAELKKDLDDNDNVSTTGSQTTFVDEDTSILLQSKVKHVLHRLLSSSATTKDNTQEHTLLTNANHAVEYIACGLSDLIFVYPGSTSNSGFFGQDLISFSEARNLQNDLVKIVQMDTRMGALQAVQGALADNGNKSVSVLATSQALLSMIPKLYELAASRQPVVFHIAAQMIDQDLVASSSHVDAVLAARQTGAILLSSANAQEAHDMAIAAHWISRSVNLPVIHFFNGVTAAKVVEKVKFSNYPQLSKHMNKVDRHDNNDIYTAVKTILGQLDFKPFDYAGAPDAETVLVTVNATSASVKEAVVHPSGNKTSVGLLSVRVFCPWSEADFIGALPNTTRRLVVLEEDAGLYAFNGPLYLEIAASVRFGPLTRDRRPRLVSAQAKDFSQLKASHLPHLVQQAEHESFINLAAEPFVTTTDVNKEVTEETTSWSGIFWDIEQDGSTSTAAAAHNAHLIQALHPTDDIKTLTARDAYHVGGPVSKTQLSYGSRAVDGTAQQAQYIEVHDIKVTQEYNVLAQAAKKTTVVLHGPWKHGDELESVLTNEFKFGLTELNAKLYTIDAARVAQELGLNLKSTHFIWEAVFLLLTHPEVNSVADHLLQIYEELESEKVVLKKLIADTLTTVKKELTAVELLPPWTILEINDQILPSTPVDRVVGAEPEDEVSSDVTTLVEEEAAAGAELSKWHKAAWQLMFNEAYKTETAVRPDLHEKTYVITVSENRRLTPESYDRYVFHMEFDTSNANLKYELGDALGVHGHNNYEDVKEFLDWYDLNGHDIISVQTSENGKEEVRTVFQLFSQTLDIFGRPSKKFYEALATFATNPKEREQLLYLVSAEGKEEFKKRVDDTITYEDLLREFTSAKPPVEALAQIIAPIKPRHYSIASSQKMHKNSVHLLVVAVDWQTTSGKKRYGQCTRYLSSLKIGDSVTVSIKPSVMKLPPLDSQPVIMAGLGTGMAPFRAFIQERYLAKATGKEVGPVVLYFGSRHRSMEYLYGEELEAYHADGVLSHMGLAFSRDQKEKIYIQHKMKEDAKMLSDYLLKQNGHFYLCGPTWPVPDVKDAIVYGLTQNDDVDVAKANALIEEWKEKESYVLEVY